MKGLQFRMIIYFANENRAGWSGSLKRVDGKFSLWGSSGKLFGKCHGGSKIKRFIAKAMGQKNEEKRGGSM